MLVSSPTTALENWMLTQAKGASSPCGFSTRSLWKIGCVKFVLRVNIALSKSQVQVLPTAQHCLLHRILKPQVGPRKPEGDLWPQELQADHTKRWFHTWVSFEAYSPFSWKVYSGEGLFPCCAVRQQCAHFAWELRPAHTARVYKQHASTALQTQADLIQHNATKMSTNICRTSYTLWGIVLVLMSETCFRHNRTQDLSAAS